MLAQVSSYSEKPSRASSTHIRMLMNHLFHLAFGFASSLEFRAQSSEARTNPPFKERTSRWWQRLYQRLGTDPRGFRGAEAVGNGN